MEQKNTSFPEDNDQLREVYDLGDCVFHASHGELHSKVSSKTLHIERKVAQVFQCLAHAQGAIITREEIFDRVWPNIVVSDDSLNRCISVLRKKLKAFGHGLGIKTHPKIGFNLEYPNKSQLSADLEQTNTDQAQIQQPHALGQQKPYVILIVLLSLVMAGTIGFYPEFITSGGNSQAQITKLNEQRVVIMPFEMTPALGKKYRQLETSYRQLITNHPRHNSITRDELIDLARLKARALGQQFDARFVIKASGFTENNRDILHWKIIDAQTGDEVFNESLNIALNPNEINARILAADFVSTTANICFTDDDSAKMQYIVDSANYLFLAHNSQTFHRPVINLLAQALTDIDPSSVEALKTLARLLTTMIGPSKDHNTTYINLAINTLNKAIDLAPYQGELYQMLSHLYLLKYQWQDAHLILRSGQSTLALKDIAHQINNVELNSYTGHFAGELADFYLKQYQDNPLDIRNALQLASLYIKQGKFEQAIQVTRHLTAKNDEWGAIGAEVGPTLVRYGNYEKGRNMTKAGYRQLGLSEDQAEVLIQGIANPDYRQEAGQFLTAEASANRFPKTLLLHIYAELGEFEAFYDLAFELIDNYQFNILATMQANSIKLRQHPRFFPLMEKVGLLNYWLEYGFPDFCRNPGINCPSTQSEQQRLINPE